MVQVDLSRRKKRERDQGEEERKQNGFVARKTGVGKKKIFLA